MGGTVPVWMTESRPCEAHRSQSSRRPITGQSLESVFLRTQVKKTKHT